MGKGGKRGNFAQVDRAFPFPFWRAVNEHARIHKCNQVGVDMMRCELGGCWLLDLSFLLNLRGELALLFLLGFGGVEFQAVEFTTALHDKVEILVLAYLREGYISAGTRPIPVLHSLRLILKEPFGLALGHEYLAVGASLSPKRTLMFQVVCPAPPPNAVTCLKSW